MKDLCLVRGKLRQELTNAIQNVYRLRTESQIAKPRSDEQTDVLNLLQKARDDQREARQAFWHHVRKHGCTE